MNMSESIVMDVVVEGGGTVFLDGTTVKAGSPFEVQTRGDVCTITFPDGNNGETVVQTTSRNGGVTVHNMVNCGNGGRGAINVCSMGSDDFLESGLVNVVNSGLIIVNGRRIVNGRQRRSRPPAENLVTRHTLDRAVKKVSLCNGSAFLCNQATLDTIQVAGSGTVTVKQSQLAIVSACVSGSGRINFEDSRINQLNAVVSGSGRITDFVAVERVTAAVSGSGRVIGKAVHGAAITQTVCGSGNAHITTQ